MPVNLLLADWGQPATLCSSTADYNAATGVNTITAAETAVTVIPGQAVIEQDSLTAAPGSAASATFLIPMTFLTSASPIGSRLVVGDRAYHITQVESSSLSGLAILHCTSPAP